MTYEGVQYSVTSLGNFAFQNCTSLASVTLPDSVESIGWYAFYNCTSLASVTIPGSVKSIEGWAFEGCTSLTSVTIPGSVMSIGYGAFYDCISLASITVDGNNTAYSSEDGVLFNKAKTELIQYPAGNTRTSYIISDSVTSIGFSAFYGCTSLASVTIPGSVTSIGEHAFEDCTSLASVAIGNSVKTIEFYAFYNCTSLASVTIPDSVTSIEYGTFERCTSLASVTIPGSVTSIGSSAFYGCTSLASVTIPGSVTSIGDDAFSHCTSLISVTIPDSVTSVESYVFSHCTSLASVTIPGSVTSIGERAFEDCTSLASVTIPGSVTSIGERAFEDCYKLFEVVNLSSLNITKGSSNYGYVAYYAMNVFTSADDATVKTTEDGFVYGNSGGVWYLLGYTGKDTTLVLPDKLESYGYEIYKYAFDGRTSLISVTIPDSVTSIGSFAFSVEFYLDMVRVSPTAENLAGKTWTGTGDGKLYYRTPGVFFITFDPNGGSSDTRIVKTTDGKLASLPTATRDGYTLDGWYTQADGGQKISTSYVFSQDTTVYAHWTASSGGGIPAIAIVGAVLAIIAVAGAAIFLKKR